MRVMIESSYGKWLIYCCLFIAVFLLFFFVVLVGNKSSDLPIFFYAGVLFILVIASVVFAGFLKMASSCTITDKCISGYFNLNRLAWEKLQGVYPVIVSPVYVVMGRGMLLPQIIPRQIMIKDIESVKMKITQMLKEHPNMISDPKTKQFFSIVFEL
jgi:hypothetical protein